MTDFLEDIKSIQINEFRVVFWTLKNEPSQLVIVFRWTVLATSNIVADLNAKQKLVTDNQDKACSQCFVSNWFFNAYKTLREDLRTQLKAFFDMKK